MSEEKSLDGTLKYYHLDVVIVFERRDNLFELRNIRRTKYVAGRKINRDSPIRIRIPKQTDFAAIVCIAHEKFSLLECAFRTVAIKSGTRRRNNWTMASPIHW